MTRLTPARGTWEISELYVVLMVLIGMGLISGGPLIILWPAAVSLVVMVAIAERDSADETQAPLQPTGLPRAD